MSRVNQHFVNLNHVRLQSRDPLFLSEENRFCVKTAQAALTDMRQKYWIETDNVLLVWDPPLAEWFAKAFNNFDKLIRYYGTKPNASARDECSTSVE